MLYDIYSYYIKIFLNNKYYIYGFKILFSKMSFTEEWLLEELKTGTTREIFRRNITQNDFNLSDSLKKSPLYARLQIYADDIKNDSSILFLKLMNQNKDNLYINDTIIQIFKEIYEWIKFKLSVNSPDVSITIYSQLNNSDKLNQITEKLKRFGIGIESISLIKVPPEKLAINIPIDLTKKIFEELTKTKDNLEPSILIRSNNSNMMFIVNLNEQNEIEYKSLEFKHLQSSASFSLEEEEEDTLI